MDYGLLWSGLIFYSTTGQKKEEEEEGEGEEEKLNFKKLYCVLKFCIDKKRRSKK